MDSVKRIRKKKNEGTSLTWTWLRATGSAPAAGTRTSCASIGGGWVVTGSWPWHGAPSTRHAAEAPGTPRTPVAVNWQRNRTTYNWAQVLISFQRYSIFFSPRKNQNEQNDWQLRNTTALTITALSNVCYNEVASLKKKALSLSTPPPTTIRFEKDLEKKK